MFQDYVKCVKGCYLWCLESVLKKLSSTRMLRSTKLKWLISQKFEKVSLGVAMW